MIRYCCLFGLFIVFFHYIFADSMQVIDTKASVLDEQFMTEEEYGGYLYQDPRGISCKRCHGEYGKGQHLVSYTSRGKSVDINAPDITQLDLDSFSNAVRKTNTIMPKYYLTDSEVRAIYKYITTN